MLRFLARFIGLWLVAAALIALVVDGAKTIAASGLVTTPFGQLWYDLDPASLSNAEAAVRGHVHPGLWDPVIVSILLAPTFSVLGIVGLLLLLAGRRKEAPKLSEMDIG